MRLDEDTAHSQHESFMKFVRNMKRRVHNLVLTDDDVFRHVQGYMAAELFNRKLPKGQMVLFNGLELFMGEEEEE